MKYFIDTYERTKGSFPREEIYSEQFVERSGKSEEAYKEERVADLGAHVDFEDGKAFCFTTGPDAEAVRRALLLSDAADHSPVFTNSIMGNIILLAWSAQEGRVLVSPPGVVPQRPLAMPKGPKS